MQIGRIYRAFIASPGDVKLERDEAVNTIIRWNAAHSFARKAIIEPVRWETHAKSEQGDDPQELINKQLLDRCDFLIAIFWAKLGQATDSEISGTVHEMKAFAERHGRENVMIFFSQQPLPQPIDTEQWNALKEFRGEIRKEGLYIEYLGPHEFHIKLRDQLDMRMNEHLEHDKLPPAAGPKRTAEPELSDAAKNLLFDAIDGDGDVIFTSSSSGTIVEISGKERGGHDPREVAKWKAALKELIHLRLIEDRGHRGQVFAVTERGYETADELRKAFATFETSPDHGPDLMPEAIELLIEASKDPSDTLLRVKYDGGIAFQTNNRGFQGDPREAAKWLAGFEQLLKTGLIRSKSPDDSVFGLTHDGFGLVDKLPHNLDPATQPLSTGEVLSSEATELLLGITSDLGNHMSVMKAPTGRVIKTNNQEFLGHDPRSRMAWTEALEQLVRNELIREHGDKGVAYNAATSGFVLAEQIRKFRQANQL